MNSFSFHQKGDPGNARNSEEGIHEILPPHEHEINITEGSEFLDDAIRTKDQPYAETTEDNDIFE